MKGDEMNYREMNATFLFNCVCVGGKVFVCVCVCMCVWEGGDAELGIDVYSRERERESQFHMYEGDIRQQAQRKVRQGRKGYYQAVTRLSYLIITIERQ